MNIERKILVKLKIYIHLIKIKNYYALVTIINIIHFYLIFLLFQYYHHHNYHLKIIFLLHQII